MRPKANQTTLERSPSSTRPRPSYRPPKYAQRTSPVSSDYFTGPCSSRINYTLNFLFNTDTLYTQKLENRKIYRDRDQTNHLSELPNYFFLTARFRPVDLAGVLTIGGTASFIALILALRLGSGWGWGWAGRCSCSGSSFSSCLPS